MNEDRSLQRLMSYCWHHASKELVRELYPDHLKGNYRNFLENQLRTEFNFSGVPIAIVFKKK